ncbi:hypothetical protein [Flavobacterium sp.]
MKKVFFLIIILVSIIACRDDTWEAVSVNRFLDKNSLDTIPYGTFDELYLKGKLGRIIIPDTADSPLHFDEPQVAYNEGYVFIEKKYAPNSKKNVIVKLDPNGTIIDSIIINKSAKIVNDYIIENDSYISWFIDGDKRIKKINDTLNLYENGLNQFSNNIKQLSLKDSKGLLTVDNFFAISHKKFIPGNRPERPKFYIHGGGNEPCELFYGTYFVSKITEPDFKLKLTAQTVCDNADIHDFSPENRFYTEDFLNFYLIDEGFSAPGNRLFYILKK